MTGGFAAIAWPAKYGNSGVMTFLVNHRDIVYQKDLGAGTAMSPPRSRSFDPDPSWEATPDSIEEIAADGEGEAETAAEGDAARGAEKP